MLPSRYRMRSSAEFATTTRSGRRSGRRTVVVHVYVPAVRARSVTGDEHVPERGYTQPAKVGFVVSKRVGNAVVRNRIRRRLRHLMYGQLSELADGPMIVVRALPAAATATSAQLARDLRGALTSALTAAREPQDQDDGADGRRRASGAAATSSQPHTQQSDPSGTVEVTR